MMNGFAIGPNPCSCGGEYGEHEPGCVYRAQYTQPAPTPNTLPAVWDLVVTDMRMRDAKGLSTYGTRLQPHNGRDALRDAYEEALDLAAYLRQAIYERDGE